MKRYIYLIGFCINVITANAQDIIVKKDGTTILAKVLTVGDDCVEYKKHSNINGPTYKITIAKLLSINYENGEKETFEDNSSTNEVSQATSILGTLSEEIKQKNIKLINTYNSVVPKWSQKQEEKDAKHLLNVVKFTENSLLENNDIKFDITLGNVNYDKILAEKLVFLDYSKSKLAKVQYSVDMYQNYALGVNVQNKTNKTIYIDLGNTFLTKSGVAQAYYTPSSTITSNGSTVGGSVNLGSVAGAVGIGGALGTLAGGINVGGANNTTISKVEYAQRVLAIPPMSSKLLDIKMLFDESPNGYKYVAMKDKSTKRFRGYTVTGLIEGLTVGDIIHWTPNNTMMSWGFYLSYSFDENCSQLYKISFDLYVSDSYAITQKMKAMSTDYVLDDLQNAKQVPYRLFIPNKSKSKDSIANSTLNIERN